MIQVSNLSKSYAGRKLFEGVTFSINQKEVVGFVGQNGCGKSTLFKILLGQEGCDSGDVIIPKGYKIGYLNQHIHFTKPSVLAECMQVMTAEEQFEAYKAEKILFGLGFTKEDMDRDPKEFSGGYQLRINLAKTLLEQPNLLLLDEPTNYLDIVSLRWLKTFLKGFRGEAVLITHDRGFMDSVATHIMGLKRGGLKKYIGATEAYYEQLALEEENYEKTKANQDKKIKHLQSFVDRFGAKASKATQAQSRVKQIQKMDILKSLDSEATLGFRFNYKETQAKTMLAVEDLAFSYSGEKQDHLFEDLNFQISPGDRLAIIGKNGKGKTTLLNVLAEQLKQTVGSITYHNSVSMGYYQQTNRKDLGPENSVADEIGLANPQLSYGQVRAICGAMMFPHDDASKKMKVLSGGEQGRVLLGKILAHPTNVLLLDEPTNHLDMESVEVLLQELDRFEGAILFVSHSEDLLRGLANKLIVFQEEKAFLFDGTYDYFLEKIGWMDEGDKKTSNKPKVSKKDLKRMRAELVQEKSKKIKPLQKKLEQIETEVLLKEESLSSKNQAVIDAISKDESVEDLYKEIGTLQKEVDSMYIEMESLTKEIEIATAEYDRKSQELLS